MNHLKSLFVVASMTLISFASAAQTATPSVASPITPSVASPITPRVDAREVKQDARIQQGVASGQLTPKETYRLEKEQAAINRVEANAKADGTVTKAERQRLNHLQNRASKDIRHQKHDAQKVVKG